jgi:hypothetical protein
MRGILPIMPRQARFHQFLTEIAPIGQADLTDQAPIPVGVAHCHGHLVLPREHTEVSLGASAEGLVFLGRIDPVEPDAHRRALVQHIQHIAVDDRHGLARDGGIYRWSLGSRGISCWNRGSLSWSRGRRERHGLSGLACLTKLIVRALATMAQVAAHIVATIGGTTMEPVAPRPMGQGAGKEQEVKQHSEREEAVPHGFLNDAPRGAHDPTVAP